MSQNEGTIEEELRGNTSERGNQLSGEEAKHLLSVMMRAKVSYFSIHFNII